MRLQAETDELSSHSGAAAGQHAGADGREHSVPETPVCGTPAGLSDLSQSLRNQMLVQAGFRDTLILGLSDRHGVEHWCGRVGDLTRPLLNTTALHRTYLTRETFCSGSGISG